MSFEIINFTEILSSYEKVNLNSSQYFDFCWLKHNSTLNKSSLNQIDTDFVYSDTLASIAGSFNVFQSVSGTILNVLVILALFKSTELRKERLTPSIISIAVTDFLFSEYVLPIATVSWFIGDVHLPYGCEFYAFSTYGLYLCSAFNLLGIAVIRCIGVHFKGRIKTRTLKKLSWIIPLLGWITSTIWLLPTLVGEWGQFGFECKSFYEKWKRQQRTIV